MGVVKGGKKRPYKRKGRLHVKKCYQLHSRQQMNAGLVPLAHGAWGSDGPLSEKIANVYKTQR